MSACAPYGSPQEAAASSCRAFGPKMLAGALTGGAGGAAVGAAAGGGRGALIGAGVGLLAGLLVGGQLDANDCRQAQIALNQMGVAPAGQPVRWSSPTGSYGYYTPIGQTYQADGRLCRRVRSDVTLQGREPVNGDYGVTCRDANGDWSRVG